MPYAPGGRPVWTTYAYDGSGRTVSVTAPDGSVTTTQYLTAYGSYSGNLVKVTDAAGKWKIQQSNGLGQLVRVIEPNPGGGADWITNYTYDALGHLVGVSMPRAQGTQARTFAYTGGDLTSATNPENGTVTYEYDGSHRVTKRTDAKGQETRYTYDAYGRLTEVQHWAVTWDTGINDYRLQEQTMQRVSYSYDTNPLDGNYSQNGWGRLTAVQYQDENTGDPFSYMYSYNAAGRVVAQHMNYNGNAVSFDAAYTWDTEGRMTGIDYGSQQYPQAYTMKRRHAPVEMGCDDRAHGRGQAGGEIGGGHIHRVRVDIDVERFGSHRADGGGAVSAGVGHGGHGVARADAQGAQGEFERVRAIGHRNTMRHAAIGGKFRFEGGTLAAQDVPTARQHAIHGGRQLGVKRRGLPQQVVQGDRFRRIRAHGFQL